MTRIKNMNPTEDSLFYIRFLECMKANSSAILAWVAMIAAILAQATIGPMFKYMEQNGISPCLAASWRCQCMTLFMIPAALAERWWSPANEIEWFERKEDLAYPIAIHVIFAGLSWTGYLLFWIIALQFTSTVQASVLVTTSPLMLVAYYRLSGTVKVSREEFGGVLLATTGILLATLHSSIHDYLATFLFSYFRNRDHTDRLLLYPLNSNGRTIVFGRFQRNLSGDVSSAPMLDSATPGESGGWELEVLGTLLCLCSAASEVAGLLNRVKIKKYVPLLQYTAITTVIVTISTILGALFLDRNDSGDGHTRPRVEIFCRGTHCIFGWINAEWGPAMLAFGFFIGFMCITGFNYAITHIPPLVFSSVNLVDPIVTGLLSWLGGVEGVPDVGTWIGGAVVIGGVFLISYGVHKREQAEGRSHINDCFEGDDSTEESRISVLESNKSEIESDDYESYEAEQKELDENLDERGFKMTDMSVKMSKISRGFAWTSASTTLKSRVDFQPLGSLDPDT